jgi:hypothetical protein
MSRTQLSDSLKLAAIATALFFVTWIVMACVLMGLSIPLGGAFGRMFVGGHEALGTFLNLVAILLPVIVPWLAIRRIGRVRFSSIACPDNVIGGMAWGGAALLWLTIALMSAGEFTAPHTWDRWKMAALALAVPSVSMITGGTLASLFLRRNISVVLVLTSPLIAFLPFVAIALWGGR